MNKSLMPMARQDRPNLNIEWDLRPQALDRWVPVMAAADPEHTISIFDPIGVDFWTGEGVTARRIASALRSIGAESDVVVNINSPGGDMFEGIAIYNLLREHKGSVTVKILGLAASAASIIAMAGDEIQIARAGFLMVHNTWVVMLGNRNELRDVADQLEPFDFAMADVYQARTGIELKSIKKKMDAETWINGSAAVEEGWADALLPADAVKEDRSGKTGRASAYALDAALAKAGLPRSERRHLLHDFKAGAASADEDSLHHTRADAGTQTPKEQDMTEDVKTPAAPQPASPEQLKAEFDRGIAEGKASAAADVKAAKDAERARISAITGHAEATGRDKLAAHFANNTEMSVDDAVKALAAAPKEAAAQPQNLLAAAMDKVPNPKVGAAAGEGGEEDAVSVGKRMAAMVNKPKLAAVK